MMSAMSSGYHLDPVALSLFAHRIVAVCDEMGVVLRRSAFSPNIRERLDFSCAVFDAAGELCAQAAHIPVHLGSMAWAMRDLVHAAEWQPGDCLMLNDPFLGGTHLPDVTLVAPFFLGGELAGFVANRAHHANIGGSAPGSMAGGRGGGGPAAARERLAPLVDQPGELLPGDFSAQWAANRCGLERLAAMTRQWPMARWRAALAQVNDHGERLAAHALARLPDGCYRFADRMEDDGVGGEGLDIVAAIRVRDGRVEVDFDGTSAQSAGNINCPLPVTAAAVFYVFRCLMPAETPACSGVMRAIRIIAPKGCLVHARAPAAVAAGNVETSMRIVDVLLGALADALPAEIPAASQGTMNNLAMGAAARDGVPGWDYYETMAGGAGGSPAGPGRSAVQTHMTNTLNTPVEVLESQYPVRVHRYAVRRGSGGAGLHRGGDGLERDFEFLAPATVTLLTERRRTAPWGLTGGGAGQCGENLLNGVRVPGKATLQVGPGDRLLVRTPGGGGHGAA